MDKVSNFNYVKLFEPEEESEFSGEEITKFKRYIEENNVYTGNCFEFFEENLNYYSVRHTSPFFYSPGRLFQSNSNFTFTKEMKENIDYYNASIRWTKKTIHPEDSNYVLKQEKYRLLSELTGFINDLAVFLNNFSLADYHCIDILIFNNGPIYKFLPEKNFVFTWRKNGTDIIKRFKKYNYYQFEYNISELSITQNIVIPIFVPIRECLFLGEFGYRDAIITYGQVLERIIQFINQKSIAINLRRFDNAEVHKVFNVDGIEKSIMDIILVKEL